MVTVETESCGGHEYKESIQTGLNIVQITQHARNNHNWQTVFPLHQMLKMSFAPVLFTFPLQIRQSDTTWEGVKKYAKFSIKCGRTTMYFDFDYLTYQASNI